MATSTKTKVQPASLRSAASTSKVSNAPTGVMSVLIVLFVLLCLVFLGEAIWKYAMQ